MSAANRTLRVLSNASKDIFSALGARDWASQIRKEIRHRWRVVGCLTVFKRPLLLRSVQPPQVISARVRRWHVLRIDNVGDDNDRGDKKDPNQGYDGDDLFLFHFASTVLTLNLLERMITVWLSQQHLSESPIVSSLSRIRSCYGAKPLCPRRTDREDTSQRETRRQVRARQIEPRSVVSCLNLSIPRSSWGEIWRNPVGGMALN